MRKLTTQDVVNLKEAYDAAAAALEGAREGLPVIQFIKLVDEADAAFYRLYRARILLRRQHEERTNG